MSGSSSTGILIGAVGGVAGFFIGGPVGAVAGAAAGYSAGAQMDGAQALTDEARRQRELNNKQAAEILDRAAINIEVKRKESDQLKGSQKAAFAKAGVDVSSQSTLVVLEHTAAEYKRDVDNTMREAIWNANAVIQEGEMGLSRAKKQQQAVEVGALGQAAMSMASIYSKSPSTTPKSTSTLGSGGDSYFSSGEIYRSSNNVV